MSILATFLTVTQTNCPSPRGRSIIKLLQALIMQIKWSYQLRDDNGLLIEAQSLSHTLQKYPHRHHGMGEMVSASSRLILRLIQTIAENYGVGDFAGWVMRVMVSKSGLSADDLFWTGAL